jgi:hypothetical protein
VSGILKIFDYKKIETIPVEESSGKVKFEVGSELPAYITSMIFVNGEVVDYKTSPERISNGIMEVTIPPMYQNKPFSIFTFSTQDGYTNRDIGRTYWAGMISNSFMST